MPSDFAPMSTTTCVPVSLSTVPLMTRSSLTASSASVVKVSSTEAKSSPAAALSSNFSSDEEPAAACGSTCSLGASAEWCCSAVVGSASVMTVEVDSELGAVVSSNKVMPLRLIGCGTCASGLLDESFGCGGPTLASELQQSQLSDVLQRTRVQWELFDYNNRERTVSNANPARVTGVFQSSRVRQTNVWVGGLSGSQNPPSCRKKDR